MSKKYLQILSLTIIFFSSTTLSLYPQSSTDTCDSPKQYYPNFGLCIDPSDFQQCYEYMDTLSSDASSVSNTCNKEILQDYTEVKFTAHSKKYTGYKQPGSGHVFANNLVAAFNESETADGYCLKRNPPFPFNNRSLCDSNIKRNLIWQFKIEWNEPEEILYRFKFYLDFGRGLAIYLNGNLQQVNTSDIWWNHNYNNYEMFSQVISPGSNVLEVYGQEGCCDGNQLVFFSRGDGDFRLMSEEEIQDTISEQYQTGGVLIGDPVEVQAYSFQINYQNGFLFDSDCLNQVIKFQDIELSQGNSLYNSWKFNPTTQQIDFKVRHKDLTNLYKCGTAEDSESFQWQCDVQLEIKLGIQIQYQYNFFFKLTVPKAVDAEVELSVVANDIQGDCCTNSLKIATGIRLCKDENCVEEHSKTEDGSYTLKRKDPLYVEHKILSPDFNDYYLDYQQIALGPFTRDPISINQLQGTTVYQAMNSIAIDLTTVSIISKLRQPDARLRRRALQDQVGEDYQVKSTSNIIIIDEEEQQQNSNNFQQQQQNQENESENEKNMPMYMGISGGAGLLIGVGITSLIFIVCQIRKQKIVQKKEQVQKAYKEQEKQTQFTNNQFIEV